MTRPTFRSVPLAALALAGGAASAQSITGLGFLPGGDSSQANAVSADGSTVVGFALDPKTHELAFRWTRTHGLESLGTVPGGSYSVAHGVNADGSVIVGESDSPAGYAAFRWTRRGMDTLRTPAGASGAVAFGVSANGVDTVGYASTPTTVRAVRWTGQGVHDIGTLPGGTFSRGFAISADGSVIAGGSATPDHNHAFRWSRGGPPAGRLSDLGVLWSDGHSFGLGLSYDGAAIIGTAEAAEEEFHAFRWTSAHGMVDLGTLGDLIDSYAYGADARGERLVGSCSSSGSGARAVLWLPAISGPIDLNSYLPSLGVDLTDWTLTIARGISADGETIVGSGVHHGAIEAWVATLHGGHRGTLASEAACYANCDASTAAPALNVLDFACFLNKFAAGDAAANCDGSTTAPVLNVLDFTCFLNAFAHGCP